MINSNTTTVQNLSTNEVVLFTTDSIKTGSNVTHVAGGGTFQFNRPGFYYVHFNGDLVTSATAGNATVQLYVNGVPVIGAQASEYSLSTTDVVNLSFSTIIQVRPSCPAVSNATSITVVNTGVDTTMTNANITITRLS